MDWIILLRFVVRSNMKKQTLSLLFDTLSDRYEQTNHILSFGLYNRWNRALCRALTREKKISHLLDLCAGTGAIPRMLYTMNPSFLESLTLVDFSSNMLAKATEKLHCIPWKTTYLLEDAASLSIASESVDALSCAYGIRNIEHQKEALKECYRVLKPNSCLFILELTRPSHSMVRFFHSLYLKQCVPFLGTILSYKRDFSSAHTTRASYKKAYDHLHNSIQHFMEPTQLTEMLASVGFANNTYRPLTCGIATLFIGRKK